MQSINQRDQIVEETNETSALDKLTADQAPLFSMKTVETMAEAIQDCEDVDQVCRALSVILRIVVCTEGSHTFPNAQLNKSFVQIVSTAVKDKLEDLTDIKKDEKPLLIKKVIDSVFDQLNQDIKGVRFSGSAARSVLKLLNAMFKSFSQLLRDNKLNFTSATEQSVLTLTHWMVADEQCPQTASRDSEALAIELLYNVLNIAEPNYKVFMRSDLLEGRYVLLAHCLKKGSGDVKAISDELLRGTEDILLNDKVPCAIAQRRINFFQYFFHVASQEIVESGLLKQIEFIMNRTQRFLGIITLVIEGLKQYKITSADQLKKWTSELLPNEVMLQFNNETLTGNVQQYLKAICNMCSSEMKQVLIQNMIVEAFQKTRNGPVKQQAEAAKAFQGILQGFVEHLSQETLQLALNVFFATTDEEDIQTQFKSVSTLMKGKGVEALIQVLKNHSKFNQHYHTHIVVDAVMSCGDIEKLRELDRVVGDSIHNSFTQENFKSVQTFANILALGAYLSLRYTKLQNPSSLNALLSHQQAVEYILSPVGMINARSFIDSPERTLQQTSNHLRLLEGLLLLHFETNVLNPAQFNCLLSNICEYFISTKSAFRSFAVLKSFESLRDVGNKFTVPFYKMIFEKLQDIGQMVKKVDDDATERGLRLSRRVELALKIVYSGSKEKNRVLDRLEFFLLLRLICHPLVSPKSSDLMNSLTSVSEIFQKQAEDKRELLLSAYFNKYCNDIVQYALIQRTGILSTCDTLRQIAKHMLICLGWQGYLNNFIRQLVVLLDCRPVEMASKLREVIMKEAEAIGPYDLEFYAVVSKDVLTLLDEKDQKIKRHELNAGKGAEGEEEQKNADQQDAGDVASSGLTPAQMQAAFMKQMAAGKGKKPAAGAKGGAAKPGQSAAGKGGAKPAGKPAVEESAEPVVDRATKRKLDTQQLLNYCDSLNSIKAKQVETVWEIILSVNKCKEANILNYQDTTLRYVTMPAIRLLGYSCTRFSTFFFFQNLFQDNRSSPFYGIRGPLMTCLESVQENKIYQRTVYDFQKVFQHVQKAADFGEMEVGFLQVILMLANFVLQSLEVNLSVKESALSVAYEILDTNPRVQNMDLVRLTINMMKSNYTGKSLQAYLVKLISRLSTEELAIMLQRLFDYDPTARLKFLQEVLAQPVPLFCPVWFSSQMWILQFDEEFFSLARKIWNRYGLSLRSEVLEFSQEKELSNIYLHMRTNNTAIFDMTVKAVSAAAEIMQGKYETIVDDLLKFYHSEIVIIKQLNLDALRRTGDDNNFEGNKRFNRIALPSIILLTSKLVPTASVEKLLDFFIVTGSADTDSKIAEKCIEAAEALIRARGKDYSGRMLEILERYIEQAQSYSPQSVAHAVALIGTLSSFLDKGGQKKLQQTFDTMMQLLCRKGANEIVSQAVCKCIPLLARFQEDRAKQIFDQQFAVLRTGKDESALRGAAYICAGIAKGQGMKFLKEKDVLNILQRECFTGKKAEALRLQAGLQLYEILAFCLGKSFEPNTRAILPNILAGISDNREPVRACANAASEQIVKNFSNFAIKLVVPMFLEGLKNDNWRGKFASVEALGNMAYCAPKQILGFLPDIVKALREVLNDTHEKVHEASLKAVSKIGSVIKCPEVAELLEVIISALGNSDQHLINCLDALLTTSFVHAIDAPSLSLLVPLVDIGLTMHDSAAKQKASQLMGNICVLTQDPEDLLPYMKILIPAVKSSLFDAIPEIRASAAKALGKLSKGLGLAHSVELLEWLNMHLKRGDVAPAERAGAAQGLSEVLSNHGDNFFSNQCQEIIKLAKSKEVNLRESYRTVMAYLPTSFANFSDYLLVLLPVMIEGLADDSEEVRKVSLKNVKICISQYGKKAAELLCSPILQMMFDKDSRVRMSSSILMYQLVKEMENDIIKAQPKYINQQMKQLILSAMFILKYDTVEKVATQASQIWKSLIDAPVHVLRMIIETLVTKAFELIQTSDDELQEMGLACMRGLVEKFGERIVNESLDILETYLEQATDMNQTTGITKVILNMSGAASHRLLHQIKARLVRIADPFLVYQNDGIRELSVRVYATVCSRIADPSYTSEIISKAFLQKLGILIQSKDKQQEIENLMKSMTFLLAQYQALELEKIIMNLCGVPTHSAETPLTTAHAVLLRTIAPRVAPLIYSKKFYNNLFTALEFELTTDSSAPDAGQERSQALLMCFAELMANVPEHEKVQANEAISAFHDACMKRGTVSFYIKLITFYCQNTTSVFDKYAPVYARNVLRHINSPQLTTVELVMPSLEAILSKLPKEDQFSLVPLIREALETAAVAEIDNFYGPCVYARKTEGSLQVLRTKSGVATIASVLQNAIMHGSMRVRVDSAFCFMYLVDFASPEAIKSEVIKICGALIRVVNDKFSPDLKLPIFLSLRLLQMKAALLVKPMVAQLQTTFLKAFGDPQSTAVVRQVVIENLMLLANMVPKADPIVKDLAAQLDSDKIDGEQKASVALALALIIRGKGKGLQEAISSQTCSILTQIIESRKDNLNDEVLVNCAVALGFFSAFSTDPSQMESLFQAYDGAADYRISLGIKIGVLMNGSDKLPNAAALYDRTKKYIAEQLSICSGIVEIDGKNLKENRPDEEIQRFDGALDAVGFLMDTYLRRLYKPDSQQTKLLFGAVGDAGIIQKLIDEEDFTAMSEVYTQVPRFITQLAIPSYGKTVCPEAALVMQQSFKFIHQYYLDFESKSCARPALLNLLQLTFNNGCDLAVSAPASQLPVLTHDYVRNTVCESASLAGIIPEDMKMVCGDIILAQD